MHNKHKARRARIINGSGRQHERQRREERESTQRRAENAVIFFFAKNKKTKKCFLFNFSFFYNIQFPSVPDAAARSRSRP